MLHWGTFVVEGELKQHIIGRKCLIQDFTTQLR